MSRKCMSTATDQLPLLSKWLKDAYWNMKIRRSSQAGMPLTKFNHTSTLPAEAASDLSLFPQSLIRNFSVIAHIDHGKSTLSDRLLELTGAIKSGSRKQYLDRLPVERSRGITVKAQTASMFFPWQSTTYLLNLIDTPGHVDFSYEVSRSLAACQGALLLVDAAQGIQAQTVSTFYAAFEADLSIIPVINKIDMPAADPERVTEEICMAFDFDPEDVLAVSAKTGEGLERVLPAIVERVPPPSGHPESPLRLLLFDSYYDEYRGVVCLVQVVDGVLQKGDKIVSLNADDRYEALEVGIFTPEPVKSTNLYTGQVGYVIMGMKTVTAARVGDTYAHEKSEVEPLPGFKPSKPMVFAGLFPINPEDFETLQASIEKLTVNDPSVMVRRDNSAALGAGYRCGFLGLLHMDVFHQRLQEEYGASVIASPPSVPYNLKLMDGSLMDIDSPSDFPIGKRILRVEEPMVIATIVLPSQFLGSIMDLCQQCRGEQIDQIAIDESRTLLRYKMPLAEIATTFYDSLKSRSSGYASFDYEEIGMQPADVIRMDLLVNGDPVDALARIVPRERAEKEGKKLVTKMKELLPRQMFDISIQASVGNKIVARETVKAYRKDVTAKLYGGDVTRKRKLLEKQKAGKKKMKRIGRVEIPQEAFYEILSR
uniref:Translation factor GUF1 homolog, mitochondrial n=1 Tax=Picocystis salinarum TaxID=88271 RepID=A0A7S3UD83_9CHLO